MLIVQVPQTVGPRQVEVSDGLERSRKGALHLRPGAVLTITPDEFEAARQEGVELRVLDQPTLSPAPSPKTDKPEETKVFDSQDLDSESGGKDATPGGESPGVIILPPPPEGDEESRTRKRRHRKKP